MTGFPRAPRRSVEDCGCGGECPRHIGESTGAQPLTVTARAQVTTFTVTLTARAASDLYNDIYRVTNDCGISSALGRGDRFPTLFALYDGLYNAGCDGTEPPPGASDEYEQDVRR